MQNDYKINPNLNTVAALGFLKDWVTAVLQLETAIVGAIAAAAALKTPKELPLSAAENVCVLAAAVALMASIYCGLNILNMLPAAAQREPASRQARRSDIYFINIFDMRLSQWTVMFRWFFMAGGGAILAFIMFRLHDHIGPSQ